MKWLMLTRRHSLTASVATLLLAVFGAAPASARRDKTDVLVLTNGDRYTGEIKGLARGRLSFDTDAAGVISVKWDRVVELRTATVFDILTADGERLLGTLAPGGTGTLEVRLAGSVPRTLTLESIVGLAPIRRSFLSRLDGSIDLGGSYTQSSGVGQLSFNFWTKARRPTFEWRVAFDDYVTFKSEGTTSEQLTGTAGYARYLSGRWAIFGQAQVERNPDLGFNLRGTLAGGVEWTVLQSNRSDISVGAGLGGSRETSVEGATEIQLPALLAFRQSLFIYDSPKTSLDTEFTAYPILNQWGRWRLKGDTSLKRELFKDFSVSFTFYESFDSRPSSPAAKRNDLGATVAIGYTF